MKRFFTSLASAAASMALAACNATMPDADTVQAVPTMATGKTPMEMEYDLRIKEMDHRHDKTLALIKFADQSKSEYAKGLVSGLLSAGGATLPAPTGGSFMDAQVARERLALQRYQLESQNSWWNRGLQVFDRAVDLVKFDKGLSFQKFQTTTNASQDRYLWDTMRGTQQDGYAFGANAYTSGSTATLGGVSAGASAASAGAAAVAGAREPAAAADPLVGTE
jgi:hypothetical protein